MSANDPLLLAPQGGSSNYGLMDVPNTEETSLVTELVRPVEMPNYNSVSYNDGQMRTKWEEATLYIQEGEDNDNFLSHPTGKWSKLAYKILHHPVFYVFDLLLRIILMLLALIERPAVVSSGPDNLTIHGVLEFIILIMLGLILFLRLIWQTPHYFFRHHRSIFITILLCVMLIEVVTVLFRQQSHIRVTRALRPAYLVDTYLMHGVRRVLRHILHSLKHIADTILYLLFIIALFSVIAYYLFGEMDLDYFKTFGISYVSLFITFTTANNPDVMMKAYNQQSASPLFFSIYLIITVFFIANILFAVMYTNFTEQEKDKFRALFLHKREALRHAFTVLTGPNGIVFHDFLLFMQHYRPRIPEWQVMCEFKALQADSEQRQDSVCLEEFYTFFEVQNLRWKKITRKGEETFPKGVKHNIYRLVKGKWFIFLIRVVILLNTLFLILCIIYIPKLKAPEYIRIAIPIASMFLFVYIVENILKIIALGRKYFTRFWNIFDIVLLSLSLVGLCLEWKYHILIILRPIKLIRLVRLKKSYHDILNTLIILTPRLISVAILLLVIYYFFAIIGMEFLEGKVYQGCCVNASYYVGTYFAAGRNENSVNIYYLMNFDNLLRSYVTLFNLMIVNNWFIVMEGFASEMKYGWLVRVYFIGFIIVTLVVLQVVIAFIVDGFLLHLEQSNMPKEAKVDICEQGMQQMDDLDSIEDETRKKKVEITLLPEDTREVKYETTYFNERTRSKQLSLDYFIRRWRRISLEENKNLKFRGRRLRTKDDVYLWQFRSDIEKWTEEQDKTFEQDRATEQNSTPNCKKPKFKEMAWNLAKKVLNNILRYLLE